MLAGLVVPFVLGHWWRSRVSAAAAAASIAVGVALRLVLFALTPTFYGADNTLLHIPNEVFGAGFDGWPTLICPVVSLAVFVAVALLAPRPAPAAPQHEVPAPAEP